MTELMTEQQIKARTKELREFYEAKFPSAPLWPCRIWAEEALREELA